MSSSVSASAYRCMRLIEIEQQGYSDWNALTQIPQASSSPVFSRVDDVEEKTEKNNLEQSLSQQPGTKKYLLMGDVAMDGARLLDTIILENGDISLILDKTVFHPQGGGQPTDLGVIRAASAEFVVKMSKEDRITGIVQHIGSFSYGGIEDLRGSSLRLLVDVTRRKEMAAIHSAGHILDVCMVRLGFALKPTKGYHFPDGPYVEYEGTMSPEDRETLPRKLKAKMREIVSENIATEIRFLPKAEAQTLCSDADLTMFSERALVRVVAVAGGWCPCGGTHVGSTEELGPISVTRTRSKKKTLRVSYEMSA